MRLPVNMVLDHTRRIVKGAITPPVCMRQIRAQRNNIHPYVHRSTVSHLWMAAFFLAREMNDMFAVPVT